MPLLDKQLYTKIPGLVQPYACGPSYLGLYPQHYIAIITLYKVSDIINTLQSPPVITNAEVKFEEMFGIPPLYSETVYTDITGLAERCFDYGSDIKVSVRKDGVDFGAGTGAWYEIFTTYALTSDNLLVVEAKQHAPGYQPPAVTPTPTCTGMISPDISALYPSNLSAMSLTPSSNLYVYIATYDTTQGGLTPVSLPLNVYLDGTLIDRINGNSSIDIIRIINNFASGNFTKPYTIKLEFDQSRYGTTCSVPSTQISVPALSTYMVSAPLPTPICTSWMSNAYFSMPGVLEAPFTINITNATWKCLDTGEETPMSNINAEVDISGVKFYIPITNGSGSLTLDENDIAQITGVSGAGAGAGVGAGGVTPTPTAGAGGCTRTGSIGSLLELQSYLDSCYPGAKAEPGTGTWTGAYKITRGEGGQYPAGTYFWALTYDDIAEFY